jgi:cobalt-zinc-cadmium efflux system membrane fusion protein
MKREKERRYDGTTFPKRRDCRRIAHSVAGLTLTLSVLVLASCGREPVEKEEEHPSDVVEVTTEAQENAGFAVTDVVRQKLERTVGATGIVSPDQTRYAHIRPLGRAVVEHVCVKLGDRVRRGDPLLEYDNIELGDLVGEYVSAFGELERAEAKREVAKKILDRAQSLLDVEAISLQEYELRNAEYRQAVAAEQSKRAELARVEEKLHRFGWTDEDIEDLAAAAKSPNALHRTSSRNVLRAPFAGIVVDYAVAPGELVDRDQRLFTLADTSTVWVLIDVYEKDIGRMEAGGPCRVSVASYPGEAFMGGVTYISDFLDPDSRTVKVRCVVPNQDGRLKLEMFAEVAIPVKGGRELLAVPVSALQEVNGDTVAFRQEDATHFEKRVVQVGERGDDWVEVVSGLSEGEKVISQGAFYLKSMLLREQIGGEH